MSPRAPSRAHAGEDGADGHGTDGLGHGSEQHVDARTMARGQFVLGQPALELARRPLHPQMMVATRHIGMAVPEWHAVSGFHHLEGR